MKILLLNPPGTRRYIRDYYCSHISKGRYYWPPLDLQVLSGHLVQDHEVFVLDAIVEDLSPDEVNQIIEFYNPQVIFFLTGSVSWLEDRLFINKLSRSTRWKTYALGDLAAFEPALCFQYFPFIDGVLSDFLSSAVFHLLAEDECFEGHGFATRSGYKKSGYTPFPERGDFDCHLPQFGLFSEKKYHLAHLHYHPFAAVLTDFGCPFTCSFCPYERIPWRKRSTEDLFRELAYHHERGIREIWFKDQSFGANTEHTRHILSRMVRDKLIFSWSCETRIEYLHDSMLELMAASGCHTVMIGIESATETVRSYYEKKYTDEYIKETITRCHRHNIKVLTHFIIGLPGETISTLESLPRYALSLDSDYATFNIATAEYGTTMREVAIEQHWLDGTVKNLDSSCSYPELRIPALDRTRVWEIHQQALRLFYLRPFYIISYMLSLKTSYQWKNFFLEGWSLLRSLVFQRR